MPPRIFRSFRLFVAMLVALFAVLTGGLTAHAAVTPGSGPANGGTTVTIDGIKFVQVSTGYLFSLGLTSQGIVYAWGFNAAGQLGDGTQTNSSTPVQVKGVGGTGYLSGVTAIATGTNHSLAVTSAGVFAWGNNDRGQLGDGSTTQRSTPVQVKGVGGTGYLSGVTAVSASSTHSLALSSTGVFAWGTGSQGELGDGTTTFNISTPVQVLGVGGSGYLTGVTSISAGETFSLATTSSGVFSWGYNAYGQLGNGSTTRSSTPVQVKGVGGSGFLTGVTSIDAGQYFSMALTSSGVYVWGYNGYGQFGDGSTTQRSTPVQVKGVGGSGFLTGATSISAGHSNAMAVTATGVYAWGYNENGVLGDGTRNQSLTPVQVLGVGGSGYLSGVTSISTGPSHTLALSSSGVYAWGDNQYGRLGDGTTTNRSAPVFGVHFEPVSVAFGTILGTSLNATGSTWTVVSPEHTVGSKVLTGTAALFGGTVAATPSTVTWNAGTFTYTTPLNPALTPTLGSAIRNESGFSAEISNYDPAWTWTASSTSGTASIVSSGSSHEVRVTGLAPGESATTSVNTSRAGYANGQTTLQSGALEAALVPSFGPVTASPNGFSFDLSNFDPSWTWSVSSTNGSASIVSSGGIYVLEVTGLAPGEAATVSVVTSRDGYVDGFDAQSGSALSASLTPQLSVPVKTSTGYIVTVANFDASWTWSTSASAGTISQGTASGSNWQLTVTGLAAGQSADLTVSATRAGYVSGSTTVTSSALSAARIPTFDAPVRTATGYTVNITNYNPGWTWTPSVSSGSVTVGSASGSTLPLTISDLSPSASSTLSVDAARSGYLTGSDTVAGTALGAARVPVLDTPVATADGFTVNVTNYDPSWTWSYVASSGTVVAGSASGSIIPVTVSGLTPGATATVSVAASRAGYADGHHVVAGATQGAQSPSASLVISAGIGQSVAGSTVTVSATGLQSTAPYSVTVYSTPRSLGTGSASAGLVTTAFTIPSGLEEGWHRIVFASIAFSGAAIEETLHFKVSSAGTLLATSTTVPAELAVTGISKFSPSALVVLLSIGIGVILIGFRRRVQILSAQDI